METKMLTRHCCLFKITLCWILVSSYFQATLGSTSKTPSHLSTTQQSLVTITPENIDYDDEQEDPTVMFKTVTDYCKNKASCSGPIHQTFPDKTCHCDSLCGLLDDCCGNHRSETETMLKKNQFSCVQLNEIMKNKNYGVYMVTKCSGEWEHNITKQLCEEETHSENIFHKLPVSHDSVMYKNMYCAQCNFIYTFEYWKPEIKCINETGSRSLPEMTDCDWFYIRPKSEVSPRTCQLNPRVIETCSDSNEEKFKEVNDNCTSGVYSVVYDLSGQAYRNKYCATCRGIKADLYCEVITPPMSNGTQTTVPKKVYSFRLLVDFNDGTVSKNDATSDLTHTCNDNEMYDSFSQKCREIFCAPPSLAVKGSCVLNISQNNNETNNIGNCTLVKLDPSEYFLSNTSELYLFSENKTYFRDEFHVIGSDVFICLQTTRKCKQDCDESKSLFHYDMIESYMSLIGLTISVVSLAITFIVYVTFSQLLNIPGRILVFLIVSLFFAQLLFLISSEFENISQLCIAVAILTHYFFLAAFCWMNVIALDLWMTFSNKFMSGGSRRNKRRFLKYNLYAWLIPFVTVCSAVILDFVPYDNNYTTLKPRYGNGVCWISSRYGLILFFAGPLGLFKLFDIVSFVFTAIHIRRAKQQGAMATQKNRSRTCSFIINLKLSLIMGLTWVFAFVANITNETTMWYLFIIFNSLQGLFIAVCFLCTRKVGRLLYDKYEQLSSKSTSGTQLSSLS